MGSAISAAIFSAVGAQNLLIADLCGSGDEGRIALSIPTKIGERRCACGSSPFAFRLLTGCGSAANFFRQRHDCLGVAPCAPPDQESLKSFRRKSGHHSAALNSHEKNLPTFAQWVTRREQCLELFLLRSRRLLPSRAGRFGCPGQPFTSNKKQTTSNERQSRQTNITLVLIAAHGGVFGREPDLATSRG